MESKPRVPDLFDDADPLSAAMGKTSAQAKKKASTEPQSDTTTEAQIKRKVSYYFGIDTIEKFDDIYHTLKKERLPIKNKSALMEALVNFALEDIRKLSGGKIYKRLL
ncbi:MAG: hypothetical protein HKP58_01220 [Desulfatitalea sp.]|nr:hypothetical protein [Desulfatitalea sp.]NNJ99007.1 hypothetical protein [Desulfatitalea sp.]